MCRMQEPRLETVQTVSRRSNPLNASGNELSSLSSLEMNGSDNSAGNDWILGICSVVFDLLEGQKLEDCFPQNALSEEEANDVAFHSFPVCNIPLRHLTTVQDKFQKSAFLMPRVLSGI